MYYYPNLFIYSCRALLSTWALATLPPNDPVRDQWSPLWHLPAASHLAAGDVNALFQWRGRWHLMSQWEMEVPTTYPSGPPTVTAVGWGHSVSPDLLRWSRVSPALVPGPPSTTMEGCYDGSVSFVPRHGLDRVPM